MRNSCEVLRNHPSDPTGRFFAQCNKLAQLYYHAVDLAGLEGFRKGQLEALERCECIESPTPTDINPVAPSSESQGDAMYCLTQEGVVLADPDDCLFFDPSYDPNAP